MAAYRYAGSVLQSGRSQHNTNRENMMKTASKPADVSAEAIRFGVEIETMVPASAGLTISAYHGGRAVVEATALDGRRVTAPVFGGHYWRAKRDGSILADPGHVACEFVSPILHGEAGIQALRDFVRFVRDIGAIEFRAFAGTLNEFKVLHYVATALGLMRRAAVAKVGKVTDCHCFPEQRQREQLDQSPVRRHRFQPLGHQH